MLVIAMASFGAIVLAWLVAPGGKTVREKQPASAVPAGVLPARA